jgi:hypothetical protein
MPTKAERETVIVANVADLEEGWFTVETTEPKILAKLKRIGGGGLEVTEQRSSMTGKVHGWLCRVPAELWRGDLRIARKRKASAGAWKPGERPQNRF